MAAARPYAPVFSPATVAMCLAVSQLRRNRITRICTFDPVKRNSELKVALGCDEADLVRLEEFYRCQPQAAQIVRRVRLR